MCASGTSTTTLTGKRVGFPERVFQRLRVRKLGATQATTQRKIFVLDAAESPQDLRPSPESPGD